MIRHPFIIIMLLCLSAPLQAGQLAVSGYVVDQSTGETVIGVNIIIRGTSRGAASDGNGYFVISGLPPGSYTLDFLHIAFESNSLNTTLTDKSVVLREVTLKQKVIELQDVSIVAEKSELADLQIETSHRSITSEAIRRIPSSYNDVFRAIKYLPGIESIDPFSPLYSVRGSDTGENLVLLDGVPVYNPYHFVNASGLFNVYAIKNVEMMVGGFGAEYGGRNSSVLYVTTREGNNQKLRGEISPNTTSTNLVVDFPVNKNTTMMLSGRWLYNLVTRFLFDAPSYFYDFNGSLTCKLDSRNRLALRYFHSRDNVDFNSGSYFNYLGTTFDTDLFDEYDFEYKTKWRNQAVSATLKSILTSGIYWQTQFYYSAFSANNRSLIDYEYEEEDASFTKLYMESEIRGKIRDLGIKSKMDFSITGWNELKLGMEWNRYHFENDMLLNGFSEGKILHEPILISGFLEDKISAGLLSLRPGIRISKFANGKFASEYRVNGAYQINHRFKIKAAYGDYIQYIISINTQEYEMSQFLDTYYPLENLAPSASRQAIVGIEADIESNIQVSLDVYHKNILRTYAYDYNASQLSAISFFEKLRQGSGESYGVELLIRGNVGKTSGWLSYGWSKSLRQFPHIMNNLAHPFDYDRPHSFKTVINHQVNPALEFSGSLRFMSGIPRSLEASRASYYYYDPASNQIGQWPQPLTPVKNNIRMPNFLRFDLGMKKRLRKGFGADLARYLGADRAFLNVSMGNLLFALQRNVWFYLRYEDKLYGVGSNYIPEFTVGYSIQF